MKRTITLRVAVQDDSEYASLLAHLDSCPEVLAWTATSVTPELRATLLHEYGLDGCRVRIPTQRWVQQNS